MRNSIRAARRKVGHRFRSYRKSTSSALPWILLVSSLLSSSLWLLTALFFPAADITDAQSGPIVAFAFLLQWGWPRSLESVHGGCEEVDGRLRKVCARLLAPAARGIFERDSRILHMAPQFCPLVANVLKLRRREPECSRFRGS